VRQVCQYSVRQAGGPSAELASAPGMAVFGALPKTAFMEVSMYRPSNRLWYGVERDNVCGLNPTGAALHGHGGDETVLGHP
jgi:hypothetical protein